MDEIESLKRITLAVFSQLVKKDLNNFTESDFEYIKDTIYANTDILLSSRTIRRLYDAYVKNQGNYMPRMDTKNAFAKQSGYKNWRDYMQHKSTSKGEKEIVEERKGVKLILQNKKIILYAFVLLTLAVCIKVLNPTKEPTFSFSSAQTTGYPVFNLSIDYDISNFKDSVKLYCWKTTDKYLDPSKNVWADNFYKPDVKRYQLVHNQKVLKEIPFLIQSKGWEYAVRDGTSGNYKYKPIKKHDGKAFSDSTDVSEKNIQDTTMMSTSFINFRKYGVSLDCCFVKIRMNIDANTKSGCNYIKFDLRGEKNDIRVTLVDSGCQSNAQLQASDINIYGRSAHLDNLQTTFDQNKSVMFMIRNKKVSIYSHGKIAALEYHDTLGELWGIMSISSGHQHIDYVEVLSQDSVPVYSENFN